MFIKSIFLNYLWLVPAVIIACESLRWLVKSRFGQLQNDNHWVHADETPRIGGLCIFLALLVGCLVFRDGAIFENQMFGYFMALALIFAIGCVEDIFGGVSALVRLLCSSIVVIVACGHSLYLDGISLQNESLFHLMPVLFLCLCATGVGLIHGTNLIDGLNGLVVFWGIGAVIVMWVCMSNSPLFSQADKELVFGYCTIFCLCITGFFFVNFPLGRVFLGDAGAYLVGFYVFVLAAFLMTRSPDSQTVLKIGAACSYPLMELGWTIMRRALINKKSVFSPDNAHLHSLIYTNIQRRFPTLSLISANNYASVVTFLLGIQITFCVSVMLPADFWPALLVWLLCPASYITVYVIASYHSASSDTK